MDQDFWHERWNSNNIGFHEGAPNALLERHFAHLGLRAGQRVFVPLCGKATDLIWLRDQGMQVVGVELSQVAVDAVVAELGGKAQIETQDSLTRYTVGTVVIYQGDFFALTSHHLGAIDVVYDRAALVALPPDMRRNYAGHMVAITDTAKQLLITFDYDQSQTDGPPFSVPEPEIAALYGDAYSRQRIDRIDITGPLANRCTGFEDAWAMTPRPG